MSVKFEVKMTDKIMYDFLLYHTYTHMRGLLGFPERKGKDTGTKNEDVSKAIRI